MCADAKHNTICPNGIDIDGQEIPFEEGQIFMDVAVTSEISVLWEDIVADIKAEYLSTVQRYPWIIGFSGGKDSTLVAQAVLEAVLTV